MLQLLFHIAAHSGILFLSISFITIINLKIKFILLNIILPIGRKVNKNAIVFLT